MDKIFLSPYSSKEHEEDIYKMWESNNLFSPEELVKNGYIKEDSKTFTILMPPPNVTGVLHLGHALEHVLMDSRIRYERMKGKRALIIPGTDHAAIATQSRVEKDIIEKEGIKNPREHYGREKLIEKIRVYAEDCKGSILNQIKRLGTSCDWSRLAYTFDEDRSKTVNSIFKKFYDEGLIYRGKRIVNWDPRLQTTVSDDEIVRKPENTTFYYLKYGPFVIGTVRPETKFGDKYVVVHPDDERYKQYNHKQKIKLEWIHGEIEATVIKDEAVDKDFGTGVMTITPWHDATDFEIARKHNLEAEQIIDWNGKLLSIAGDLEGVHIKKARPLVIERLKEKGLIEKIDEEYENNVAISDRSGEIVEPQIKEQWFIDVEKKIASSGKSLNDLQKEAIKTAGNVKGEIEIYPDRFKKNYFEWVNNPRDWCISRQIWWGHRIPVWYRGEEVYCDVKAPTGDGWVQDEDTLDTWFSSGTWSFSTLGQTDVREGKTEYMKTYHPTSWIQMGYEILFLWMARMILMSKYAIKEIPFEEVYIHGLVRDKNGRKFSKSLRNTIDPIEIIDKYGSDSLRLALITGVTSGNDINFLEEKVKHSKHFVNKLWNISRFVLQRVEDEDLEDKNIEFSKDENELKKEVKEVKDIVGKHMEESKFHLAFEEIYKYVWHRFADKIIEESKDILNGENKKEVKSRSITLYFILVEILKMLHPFAPFVTETIYQRLPSKNEKYLMVLNWD